MYKRQHEDRAWKRAKRQADKTGEDSKITMYDKMCIRDRNSVSSILEHTAADGKTYKTQFYNLDAIISVGYRVNSIKDVYKRQIYGLPSSTTLDIFFGETCRG